MHKSGLKSRGYELGLFAPENQRSFLNILPEAMVRQIQNLSSGDDSYLLGLAERTLVKEMSRRGKGVTDQDFRLRNRFWFEYERFQEHDDRGKMHMPMVIGFVISKEAFYKHYITDPVRLAYLICPTVDYLTKMDLLLNRSMDKIIEIIDAMEVSKPELHEKYLHKLLQIQGQFKYKERSGPKVKAKSVGEKPETPKSELPDTKEAIQARIAELESRRKARGGA